MGILSNFLMGWVSSVYNVRLQSTEVVVVHRIGVVGPENSKNLLNLMSMGVDP